MRLIPEQRLDLLSWVAATREDVTVSLIAAAVAFVLSTAARSLSLRLLVLFAYAHCALLAVNAVAVHWLGTPLTMQWLHFADLLRSQTPRAALAAAGSPGVLLSMLVISAAPFWVERVVRVFVTPRRLPWLAGVLLVGSSSLAASAAFVQLGGDNFRNFRESPVTALTRSLSAPEPRFLDRPVQASAEEYLPASPFRPDVLRAGGRPNVILIVLESVGALAMEAERHHLPNVSRLIESGRYFPNAYAATASSPRSLLSLITSTPPVPGGQADLRSPSAKETVTLPQLLRSRGYRTSFFGVDLAYAGGDDFLRRSFEEAHDVREGCAPDSSVLFPANRIPDACLFNFATRWAIAALKPFFMMIWTNDTHSSYTSNGSGLPPASRAAYRAGLVTSDRAIGAFLGQLQSSGLLERSIVIVVGDHGEAFGEHGRRVHSTTVFEEEVRVPLVLWTTDGSMKGADARLARLIDVAPTVSELAAGTPPVSWRGVSLFGGTAPRRAFFFSSYRGIQIGFREGTSKTLLDFDNGRFSKYRLDADPLERNPVPLTESERAHAENVIARWVQWERRQAER